MAVRFLPSPAERGPSPREDRPDLAEVIELRSELVQRRWLANEAEGGAEDAAEPAPNGRDTGARNTADRAPGSRGNDTASVPGQSSARGRRDASPIALRPARALLGGDAAGEPRLAPDDGWGAASGSFSGLGSAAYAGSGADAPTRVYTAQAPATPQERAAAATEPGSRRASGDSGDAERARCSEDGVRLLARRARSSDELRAELTALEHDPHEIEDVIAEFEASLYLDDDGLARNLAAKLRETKRASRAQIRRKLRERKLPDTAIEEALGELDDDEEFALLRETAAQRAEKLTGLDRQTAERRLLGFLARRGWSGEPASRAARDALDLAGTQARGSGVRFR